MKRLPELKTDLSLETRFKLAEVNMNIDNITDIEKLKLIMKDAMKTIAVKDTVIKGLLHDYIREN